MSEIIKYSKITFAFLRCAIGWFFLGLDSLIYALIAFVVIDYVAGYSRKENIE